ncbi:hypothetical protein [Azospirillum thermophilum]|uniref:hypothetical protein n=1 Tax=Azospirillum thermophilum TaxID=2202148 RepID=UPI001FED29D0|nr:hypothetical protein [Azospirillum thermophilum]
MLGLYLHRDSPVHRWAASVKLGGLLLVTVAVLAAPGAWGPRRRGCWLSGWPGWPACPWGRWRGRCGRSC